MFSPILTDEEKIIVKSLSKRKKQKGLGKVNVYFNRRTSADKNMYYTGKYESPKTNGEVTYRSSYELKHFMTLDADDLVANYYSEVIEIPYVDSKGKKRKYIPDLIVVFENGDIEIHEIKPKEMLKDSDVQKKAQACRKFASEAFGQSVRYRFITEEDLFKSSKDYMDFLQKCKKKKTGKK